MKKDGVLLVDKPEGWTSFQVVSFLRRKTGIKKIGHAGTLDPFATGLLILLFGKMTRLAGHLSDMDKTYEASLKFGEETDTQDLTGTICGYAPVPNLETIQKNLKQFTGAISQTPPKYSAIHVNGKRAYDLARDGKDFELKSRPVTIHDLSIVDWENPILKFLVRCSKGTYVRTLAFDWARACGSAGHLSALRRTSQGCFELTNAKLPSDMDEINFLPDDLIAPALGFGCLRALESTEAKLSVGADLVDTDFSELTVIQGKHLVFTLDGEISALVEKRGQKIFYLANFGGRND